MDNVRQAGHEADGYGVPVDGLLAASRSINQERRDGNAGRQITIKILRPRIVVAIEIVLKERWRGPDENGGENRGIAFRRARAPAHADNLSAGIQVLHRYFLQRYFARLQARNRSNSRPGRRTQL